MRIREHQKYTKRRFKYRLRIELDDNVYELYMMADWLNQNIGRYNKKWIWRKVCSDPNMSKFLAYVYIYFDSEDDMCAFRSKWIG